MSDARKTLHGSVLPFTEILKRESYFLKLKLARINFYDSKYVD